MPANLVFRLKIWGARDNGIPPRSTPVWALPLAVDRGFNNDDEESCLNELYFVQSITSSTCNSTLFIAVLLNFCHLNLCLPLSLSLHLTSFIVWVGCNYTILIADECRGHPYCCESIQEDSILHKTGKAISRFKGIFEKVWKVGQVTVQRMNKSITWFSIGQSRLVNTRPEFPSNKCVNSDNHEYKLLSSFLCYK